MQISKTNNIYFLRKLSRNPQNQNNNLKFLTIDNLIRKPMRLSLCCLPQKNIIPLTLSCRRTKFCFVVNFPTSPQPLSWNYDTNEIDPSYKIKFQYIV